MKRKLSLLMLVALMAVFVTGMFGCGPKESDDVQGEPIVIAVPTALGSIEGADGLRAVQMAAEEINAKGGVSVGGVMRLLKIVSTDTREHEPGIPTNDAITALEAIILKEEPHAILVGNFRSEVLLAAMDVIADHKIPYITTIAMTPVFEKNIAENYEDYKYMFRLCLNAPYLVGYLNGLMGYLGEQFEFDKAYLVVQDVQWAQGTGGGVKAWLEANGWEVVGFDAYPTGASDFSSSLTKAKLGGAQVIIPIFDMPQAGILVKQAGDMAVPALLAGFISPAAPESAWDAFGSDIDGLINFIFEIGPLPVAAVPKSVEFNQNYGKKYGENIRRTLSGHSPGPAYDSVYVLVDAIERAGSLDPDAVAAALVETDMTGVIGRIRFNQNHQVVYGFDPAETALGGAFQWRNGKRVPVFPALIAEDKIQLPASMR